MTGIETLLAPLPPVIPPPAASSTAAEFWSTTTTAAAVFMAALFALAAGAKLRRNQRTVTDFAGLGLRLSRPLAVAAPVAELMVAAALLVRPQIGGSAAVVLLAGFTVVLARALRSARGRGQSVNCSCFGSLSRNPVSSATLVRNGVLMVVAAVAATGNGLARPDVGSLIAISLPIVIALVISQLLAARRQLGRIWSVELAGEIR
ncbi:MAG: hypothetical protein OER95_14570 [Acidimicrobiia bacterium]|nr:hypothetical protein [Acidimicrobiia bacterium]